MSDALISRRGLLKGVAAAGAAVTMAPLVSTLGGCGNDVAAAPYVDGAIVDGQVRIVLEKYPALKPVGGAIIVVFNQSPPPGFSYVLPNGGLLIIHRTDGTELPDYMAVDSSCPHAGCPLGYSPSTDRILCPCHSSSFRTAAILDDNSTCDGQVLHGPAASNLQVWPVLVEGDTLIIDLRSIQYCVPPLPGTFDPITMRFQSSITMVPELATVGGSIVAKIPGLTSEPMLLARTDEAIVIGVSAICTHRQCTVLYKHGLPDPIRCPCHDSHYALDGTLKQPAQSPPTECTDATAAKACGRQACKGGACEQGPLRKFKVSLDSAGTVTIDLNP